MAEQKSNRLAKESSPYLRRHAHNPVDWFPWGQEAFEKAKKEDKPIFLSIGYSSCHWCHVMEEESFEDQAVAKVLNRYFIAIKVDREERPDIDDTYMTAAQMISGQGGWPLTIIMTPDKRPFFAATFLPKEASHGMMGLLDLLPAVADFWKEKRGDLETSAARLVIALKSVSQGSSGDELGELVLDDAFQRLMESFDQHWAGFGTAPKFPIPHRLTFLLRYWRRTKEPMALFIVDRTLEAMRHGGIFDQIGFGFHRYSVDRQWIVPHFEKMLYDQALISIAYLECYQTNGREELAHTARQTLDYVLRDLTSPEGAFYSAEDADSEGEEGKFYLWTDKEIEQVLNPDQTKAVFERFDIQPEGNYELGLGGAKKGNNILHMSRDFHDAPDQWDESLPADALGKLFEARERRSRPLRDDKIMVDWNSLMIAALAIGARTLAEKKYSDAAVRCADLLLEKGLLPDGRVKHLLREDIQTSGFLEDHAFLAWALIEVYGTTFEARYLQEAIRVSDAMILNFWDRAEGGFFETADDAEGLLTRSKNAYDGAVPSGNSIAMIVLFKLHLMTGREDLRDRAIRTEKAFSKSISEAPQNSAQFLSAVDLVIGPTYEISIVGGRQSEGMMRMLTDLNSRFIPSKVVVVKAKERPSNIEMISPLARDREAVDGKATAYVCLNRSCLPPVTSSEDLLRAIGAG